MPTQGHFGLQRTVAPASEPLTLAEAKAWLRVDSDDTTQDAVIADLIAAARERCERVARRALLTQTWVLSLDRFPGYDPGAAGPSPAYDPAAIGWGYLRLGLDADPRGLRLPRPPLQSVSSITYVDTTGATQTLATSVYDVDAQGEPARVIPSYGQMWPIARVQMNAVLVTYVAGYTSLPLDIKGRIRHHVAYSYERREEIDDEYLDRLFEPFRVDW